MALKSSYPSWWRLSENLHYLVLGLWRTWPLNAYHQVVDAIDSNSKKLQRENLSCTIIVGRKGVYESWSDNYCRALIFNPVDAILGAPLLEPESANYVNDQIFLCIDEKHFYVNGGAVLCIISRVSCDAGLAGRAGPGIKFASQFSFQFNGKTENFPEPHPASFSMLSQCGEEGAVEMKLFCLKWGEAQPQRGGRSFEMQRTNMAGCRKNAKMVQ